MIANYALRQMLITCLDEIHLILRLRQLKERKKSGPIMLIEVIEGQLKWREVGKSEG
jgi:hypothetical protein